MKEDEKIDEKKMNKDAKKTQKKDEIRRIYMFPYKYNIFVNFQPFLII